MYTSYCSQLKNFYNMMIFNFYIAIPLPKLYWFLLYTSATWNSCGKCNKTILPKIIVHYFKSNWRYGEKTADTFPSNQIDRYYVKKDIYKYSLHTLVNWLL